MIAGQKEYLKKMLVLREGGGKKDLKLTNRNPEKKDERKMKDR